MDESERMEELIKSVGDNIWTFCQRLTYNRLDAEDLYQDTILKAVELKSTIDYEKNPRAFIYSLAVSINNNKLRKILRRGRIAPTYYYEEEFFKDSNKSVESEFLLEEEKVHINQAIDKLTDKQKPVVLMFYMEDLSIIEISKYLKIPEGTVKSRLYSGRKILKEELEGKGYGK